MPLEDFELPRVLTRLPGPNSIAAADKLRQFEGVGISSQIKGGRPVFWKRATGCMVEDLDGNIFLDCTSSFGVATIGYSHPRVNAAVVAQQAELCHTMAGIFPHIPYVDVAEAIVGAVGRSDSPQVILTTSGSEAVEVAIKLCSRYTGRPGILAFQGGYHGQSLGALSVTSHNGLRDPFLASISSMVAFAPYPDPFRPPLMASFATVADACLESVRSIVKGGRVGGHPIGGVLVEPLQNASGYIVPPAGFVKGLAAICKQEGILLILDEIFTGFGRTGRWLAADHEAAVADIVCVGKGMTGGLPMGACVADRRIMSGLITDEIIPLHGSTFMANPIACASALAAIQVLRDERLIERATLIGARLLSALKELCIGYPFVGEVRGSGAAIAIDFVSDRQSKARAVGTAWSIADGLLSRGIITLVTGLPYCNVLAVCPPFVISEAQCDHVVKAIHAVLEEFGGKR